VTSGQPAFGAKTYLAAHDKDTLVADYRQLTSGQEVCQFLVSISIVAMQLTIALVGVLLETRGREDSRFPDLLRQRLPRGGPVSIYRGSQARHEFHTLCVGGLLAPNQQRPDQVSQLLSPQVYTNLVDSRRLKAWDAIQYVVDQAFSTGGSKVHLMTDWGLNDGNQWWVLEHQ
jgi:hypothetical protein